MMRWPVMQVVVLGIFSSVAFSQGSAGDAAAEQRKRLIEQKLRLVESLVNSPAAQASAYGREAETPALVLSGRKLLDRAREALAANQLEGASVALDEALRQASKASARISNQPGALSQSVQQANYKNLSEQIVGYRGGIDDLARQGNDTAKSVAARIHALQAEAGRLGDAGQFGDANRKLADAYKLAVETISTLRAGQTVMLSLKFDTPAEEYSYERKRFQSNEILVDMMIGEGRADGERRNRVDGFVRDGRKLAGQAGDQANSGDFKGAVAVMEQASVQLNRALQIMGVPVF